MTYNTANPNAEPEYKTGANRQVILKVHEYYSYTDNLAYNKSRHAYVLAWVVSKQVMINEIRVMWEP